MAETARGVAVAWLVPGETILRFSVQDEADGAVRNVDGLARAAAIVSAAALTVAAVWALRRGTELLMLAVTAVLGCCGLAVASSDDPMRMAMNGLIMIGALVVLAVDRARAPGPHR